MSELRDKQYQVQITEESLCGPKLAEKKFVLSSSEKTMLKEQQKTVILKLYQKHFWLQLVYKTGDKNVSLPKTRLSNDFDNAPEYSIFGTHLTNTTINQKLRLSEKNNYPNGLILAVIPVSKTNNKKSIL